MRYGAHPQKGPPFLMSLVSFRIVADCGLPWFRYNPSGRTAFIVSFYALPTGLGRSRLLARYARSIAPWFHPPRCMQGMAGTYGLLLREKTCALLQIGLNPGPRDPGGLRYQ
jgi:Pheophorbide a oxygenase